MDKEREARRASKDEKKDKDTKNLEMKEKEGERVLTRSQRHFMGCRECGVGALCHDRPQLDVVVAVGVATVRLGRNNSNN